ncbi:hypothetical protein W97_06535 [Coniosporium apollinis CBS 100218]|uniref:Uncharacterized protein n=1 Tax=Coniosporium apollinis (strain CBS 100218) TaxID=1168221 RepID=R7YZE6_CONA1|nr:uncharacterized protein W97_06535 [Coniosporium apollinis CBS 100218]EON67282.1 hypothetical protein W97_06535 [Coniosporium apollinis CBS 100218]
MCLILIPHYTACNHIVPSESIDLKQCSHLINQLHRINDPRDPYNQPSSFYNPNPNTSVTNNQPPSAADPYDPSVSNPYIPFTPRRHCYVGRRQPQRVRGWCPRCVALHRRRESRRWAVGVAEREGWRFNGLGGYA